MASTRTAPLTLEEFAQLSRDGARHEVNAGELIIMPPSKFLHSRVVRKIFKAIETALEAMKFGEVLAEAGYVLSCDPLTIRQPDISVISSERIRTTRDDGYVEGAPELAVEVVSPSDSVQDLEVKVDQYLVSGAKQVWIVSPNTKRVYVFSPSSQPRIYDETQTLDGGDLLPGFSVKIADFFVSENRATS